MASEASSDDRVEVVKWYTRARRFPQLIGKTADGTTIWGGPYTYTQAGVGAAVLIIGSQTIDWWGQFGLVTGAPGARVIDEDVRAGLGLGSS